MNEKYLPDGTIEVRLTRRHFPWSRRQRAAIDRAGVRWVPDDGEPTLSVQHPFNWDRKRRTDIIARLP